jgi:hypothetical protein
MTIRRKVILLERNRLKAGCLVCGPPGLQEADGFAPDQRRADPIADL